jgi:nitrite reductase/ring-hydroxylating ferredoxin subunit
MSSVVIDQDICAAEDVPEGEVRGFQIDGRPAIAVYRLEGVFYATDDLCTHGEASLADGEIEDGEIICPFHLGSFCIKTGEPRAAPCSEPIRTYPVRQEAGRLIVTLEG